jgi:alpha-tubulin suppressor-like RCC1 family protein
LFEKTSTKLSLFRKNHMSIKSLRYFGIVFTLSAYAAVPKITSVLPTSLSCGIDDCLNKTITITGTGFNNDAKVPALDGLADCTSPSVVSGSTKKIVCTLSAQQTAGSFTLKVKNDAEGTESVVTKSNFSLSFAAPKVSSVTPSSLTCGSNNCLNQVVIIKGSNFRSDASVPVFNGIASCGSATLGGTQISCSLNAQTKSAKYNVAVRNDSKNQTASVSSPNFTVLLPTLTATSVSPNSLTCGLNDCLGQKITIKGTGFNSDAAIPALTGLAACDPPNTNGTEITCTLNAQSKSGTYKLNVKNLAKNQTSPTGPTLLINTLALTVSSVSPSSLICGNNNCLNQSITITGTGFKNNTTIPALTGLAECNPPNLAGTQITCALKAQSVAKTYALFAKNVDKVSPTSVNLAISFAVPKITSVTPSTFTCGSNDCLGEQITIAGTDFRSDAVVPALAGIASCDPPNEAGTQITCTLSTQLKSASYKLSVKNLSTNQSSNVSSNNFSVYLTPLTLTSVTPSTLSCDWDQCNGQQITFTGTGFKNDATVPALTNLATCAAPNSNGTQIICTLRAQPSSNAYKLNVRNVAKNVMTNVATTNLQINLKALPTITNFDSDSLNNCSGQKVAISGTDFGPNAYLIDFPGVCESPSENGTKINCLTTKNGNSTQNFNVKVANPNLADLTKPFVSTLARKFTLVGTTSCASITYASTTAEYPIYEEIPENAPIVSGFTPTSYSISPELPFGFEFDTATGVISGTPTTIFSPTDFTVTASGENLSTSKVVRISTKRIYRIFHNNWLFARIDPNGSVVFWNDNYAADTHKNLTDVKNIFTTSDAYAALKNDGTVVTGGFKLYGGDSSGVDLSNVKSIFSTSYAFAALKENGTVVTWGDPTYGGDSSSVQAQLHNVKSIASTSVGFAALKEDGTVVTWGNQWEVASTVQDQLKNKNVKKIFSNSSAFVALTNDKQAIAWGNPHTGGYIPGPKPPGSIGTPRITLTDVKNIYTSSAGFIALKSDDSIVAWGKSSPSFKLATTTDVQAVYSSKNSFRAVILKKDGKILHWGYPDKWSSEAPYGIDWKVDFSEEKTLTLNNIKTITLKLGQGDVTTFAALKNDGTVVVWGDPDVNDNGRVLLHIPSASVQAQLTNVKTINSNWLAFAALKNDGTVVTWGDSEYGGDSSNVKLKLKNIKSIKESNGGFIALKEDGRVVELGYVTTFRKPGDLSMFTSNRGAFALSEADVTLQKYKIISWGNISTGGGVTLDNLNLLEFFAYETAGVFSNPFSFTTVVQAENNPPPFNLLSWGDPEAGGLAPAPSSYMDLGISFTYPQWRASTDYAYAVAFDYCDDQNCSNKVVTWGHPEFGGDSSAVKDQLVDVNSIYSNPNAFAALKNNGTVVTWGSQTDGGNSSAVKDQLVDVNSIFSTSYAFAALKKNGSVVTWGSDVFGGDSSGVNLTNITTILSNSGAFLGIKNDGSIVSWGLPLAGAEIPSNVMSQLTNLYKIYSSPWCFAALKNNGTVVSWGSAELGCDSSGVQDQLTNVVDIYPNGLAFAALKEDGSVVTWGDPYSGGNSSSVQAELTKVIKIFNYKNGLAFAALKDDGSVVTWGDPYSGGNSSSVQAELYDIREILTTDGAFLAYRGDGKIITWGNPEAGGDYPNSY